MKYFRIIGSVWIIFALYNFFFGLNYLYQYSTPGVLWLYMIPICITFGKIFLGIISLIIGISILKKKHDYEYLLIPFLGILSMYLLIDFIKLGIEVFINFGSNILLLFFALITINLSNFRSLTEITIAYKRRVAVITIIGLVPYFFDDCVSYDWFNFLHSLSISSNLKENLYSFRL